MNTNKQAALNALSESDEGLYELSDADLEAVHGGIVIGSRYPDQKILAIRDPGLVIREHGFGL